MKRVYPKKVGKCLLCDVDIIAKNSGFDKPNRRFCSKSCRAKVTNKTRVWTPQAKEKVRKSMERTRSEGKLNHHTNPEYLRQQSERYKGERSHFWKGGLSSEKKKIRESAAYRGWRRHVFERDNYTCQACGVRGGLLNADHVMPFALYSDLRLEILNGRTLCQPCHKKTPTFAIRSEFLINYL